MDGGSLGEQFPRSPEGQDIQKRFKCCLSGMVSYDTICIRLNTSFEEDKVGEKSVMLPQSERGFEFLRNFGLPDSFKEREK